MIQYNFTSLEIEEILQAFQFLGMNPLFKPGEIRVNWKKKALLFHPDKAQNSSEKESFHEKFISLTKARDICLQACEVEDIEIQFHRFNKKSSNLFDTAAEFALLHRADPEDILKREEEWEEFVKDQNTYFNLLDASLTSFWSFLRLTIFSVLFTVGSMILSLLGITALLGIFTPHVNLPLWGWIGGLIFFIWFFMLLQDFMKKAEQYTLRTLSETGYPFRSFLLIWAGKNLLIILLSFFWEREIIYALIFSNLGFWFLYDNLHPRLFEIEQALERLRNREESLGVIFDDVRKQKSSNRQEKASK